VGVECLILNSRLAVAGLNEKLSVAERRVNGMLRLMGAAALRKAPPTAARSKEEDNENDHLKAE
jgi:hypothetical protein